MTEEDGELIKNVDENEHLLENIKPNKKTIIFLVIGILLLLIIIIVILIFTVFQKDNKENENKSDTIVIESDTELDTISSEEFDRARKSFKQFNYTETNSSLIL